MKKVRNKGLLKIQEANRIILHEDVAVNFKNDAKHVWPIVYNLIKRLETDKTRKTIKQVKRYFQESESSNSSIMQTLSERSLELSEQLW